MILPGFHSGEESSSVLPGGDGGERFQAHPRPPSPSFLALDVSTASAAAADASHRPCAGSKPVREGCLAAARDALVWGRVTCGPGVTPGRVTGDVSELDALFLAHRRRVCVPRQRPGRVDDADVPGLCVVANVRLVTRGCASADVARFNAGASSTATTMPDLSIRSMRSTCSLTSAKATLCLAASTGVRGAARDAGRCTSFLTCISSRWAPFHPPRRCGAMPAPLKAPSMWMWFPVTIGLSAGGDARMRPSPGEGAGAH